MKPSALLNIAHRSMAATLIISLIVIYLIYGIDLGFAIPMLVFLHILFVIMAAIFKISYVARLTALKQLGRPVH
ncbi:hypothetical protein GCM10011613_24780 [Cellvibrio zantedeschiae]|uniref:Transmembrane sensor/regulator PpyR n=1 Tax=Cellvibrio zantedeschiae TaxID=1237077 RepID=A0ABQ3B4L3_9GAMM|nr:hypothetical protein [Cellvibrio zantedeschiae]GGY79040.1 hypothetical protein GCM10011613_24780 [Cellvibrio zantedeschiae]